VKFAVRVLEARMRGPFVFGTSELTDRPLVLVSLTDADGCTGYGEAAPLPRYDGITLEHVTAALEDCRAPLEAAATVAAPAERQALLDACARRAVLPQAVAAIDLALWDLAGRQARAPVWRLLGAERAQPVPVNWSIAAPDRAGAAREAAFAQAHGFSCVKVKVGSGDDAGRIAAVRAAAGPDMQIRLDANGVWSYEEAVRWLEVLAPARIELCEEPVAGVEEIERVAAATATAVAIDESAADPAALQQRRCTAICLKIARCGGITGLLKTAARARCSGYDIYLASTLDGPLGIAAALHATAVLAVDRACGLATLPLFGGRSDPLPATDGMIAVPDGPGLGAGLNEWYR
jgi:o-succinylbenzoate synthase